MRAYRSMFAATLAVASLGSALLPSRLAAEAPRLDATLVALGADGTLLRFRASAPAAAERVRPAPAGIVPIGIDVRPKNGKLYGLTAASDVYEIDPSVGATTLVATLTIPFDAGEASAFDFNPQSDRLRLIGRNGQNLRVHPELGAAANDAAPAYARSDTHGGARPVITGAAYTNAVADTPTTKLFDIDTALDVLVLQEPPNDGILTTIGDLGVDFDAESGFDILTVDGVDHAFAAARATLYAVDLATGRATALGTIGDGSVRVTGLAALPPSRGDESH